MAKHPSTSRLSRTDPQIESSPRAEPTGPAGSSEELDARVRALREFDVPSIVNGLKRLRIGPSAIRTMDRLAIGSVSPTLPPLIGYAVTQRLSTRRHGLPADGAARLAGERVFQKCIADTPGPRVLVTQNVGDWRGQGCVVGGLLAGVYSRLGCVGAITNGAVRDVDEMESYDFHVFANGLGTGGSYIDFVDAGEDVEMGGQVVRTGDLIFGDRYGVVLIPSELADRLPDAIRASEKLENEMLASGDSFAPWLASARKPR